jgi:hypothetical protein
MREHGRETTAAPVSPADGRDGRRLTTGAHRRQSNLGSDDAPRCGGQPGFARVRDEFVSLDPVGPSASSALDDVCFTGAPCVGGTGPREDGRETLTFVPGDSTTAQ